MTIDTDAILNFWFGEIKDGWAADKTKRQLWFAAKRENDEEVKTKFAAMLNEALSDETPDTVPADPRETLARIILLDQITRMTNRATAAAFIGDAKARALCKHGLQTGAHKTLPPICQMFFYLPLEHSEDLADQELCVKLFAELRDETPQHAEQLKDAHAYAVKHYDIIKRFNRFPHRNNALGRTSTPEEVEYLKDAEKFGQG